VKVLSHSIEASLQPCAQVLDHRDLKQPRYSSAQRLLRLWIGPPAFVRETTAFKVSDLRWQTFHHHILRLAIRQQKPQMTRPLKGFAHACKNLPRRVFIAFASVYRRRTIKAASDGSERDETWANQERLVTQLLTTPFLRLAILGPDGAGNATFIRGIIRNSRVQGYFAECCAIVSCDGALSADAVIDRLAVELGVLETVADPFAAVLGKLVTHKRTLIVFNQLDAIYSMIGPEQQKAIDFLLVTLAGVEKLSLVVTFSGTLLPECVAWTMVEYSGGTPSAPKAQAVPSQPANRPLYVLSRSCHIGAHPFGPVCSPILACRQRDRPSSTAAARSSSV